MQLNESIRSRELLQTCIYNVQNYGGQRAKIILGSRNLL
jgi:hypothetical protein